MKTTTARTALFGPYAVDLRSGELWKYGTRVKMGEQPFQILLMLLERSGELVTREELRAKLWANDTFVDFDHGLNSAVQRLRDCLSDTAEKPLWIETIPRRGYRFIAPVESQGSAPPGSNVSAAGTSSSGATSAGTRVVSRVYGRRAKVLASASVLSIALLVGLSLSGVRELLFGRRDTPRIQSLAVLPLVNLSSEADQDYFADGMTEELIAELSKISALRVISRTSVMQYKGTKKPLPEIARELGVEALVEGSVVRSGGRVRVTANLVQANPEKQLWTENYERDLRDALALQDEVARDIANEIKVKLTPQEQVRLTSARPVNPEAQDFYLKGRYYWNKRTPEALKKSLEYFHQATEKDPSYALAYAGLADAYAMLGAAAYAVLPPKEAYPRAEAAAMKALQLDNTLAEAHTSLGWVRMAWSWDWAGAEREYKQAIELNSSYANAHHWYAAYLSTVGRHTEAIAEDRKAESLDPLSLIISFDVAMEALHPARLYDQQMEQCRKTLEMDPNFANAHACLSNSYIYKGMYNEAIAEIQKGLDLSGGSPVFVSLLGYTYAVAGRRDQAIKTLNELKARSKREYVAPGAFFQVYVGLGDKDQAFAWLEKAYDERGEAVLFLKVDPDYDSLRSDPRFQDLQRRVGLPP